MDDVLIRMIFTFQPTNIRMTSLNDIKLLDYNSARHLANKKAGEVVDVIGDTEFCGKPGNDITFC